MPRRFLLFCLLATSTVIRTLVAADSSEQFLQAYQSYEQGERAEREGNTQDALKNYRFAESLLQAVSQKDPAWQKAVVEYRLKKIRDGLARLGQGSDSASSRETSPADTSAADTSPEPRTPSRGPSITITVPTASGSSRTQGESGGEVRRLNRLIDSLRNELRSVKEASLSEKGRAEDLDKMQWTKDKSQMEEQLTRARDEIATLREKVRQRDSWEHDLKDLQKRLDEAVADKASAEEFFQQKNKRMGDDMAVLTKQLEEARAKIARSGEGGKQAEELSRQVERDAESLKQLQARLDQALQSSKESETRRNELQSKMTDLTARLEQVQKRNEELTPLRDKIAALRKEADASRELRQSLEKRDADFAVLQEEREGMARQIRQLSEAAKEASKVQGLESQSEEFRKTIASLREQVAAAARQAEDARRKVADAELEAKDSSRKLRAVADAAVADKAVLEEEKRGLERRLADLGTKIGSLESQKDQAGALREKLDLNARELKESADKLASMERERASEKAELEKKSTAAQSLKDALQSQNASLQLQLKDALGRLETFVNSSAEGEAVKGQLASLKQQLDDNVKSYQESQKKLSELASSRPEHEEQLRQKQKELDASRAEAGKLRGDLEDANRRIADLQTRTSQTEDRLKKLQDQLSERDAQLAAAKKKRGSKITASAGGKDDENGVLREIILRQLKEEAKRAQARRLVQEEMKRLNVQSQVFNDQLAVLSSPVAVLSPEERALFKDEQLVVLEGDSGAMQAAVAAPLGKDDSATANPESHDTNAVATPAPPDATKGNVAEQKGDIPWQGKFKQCLSRAKEEFDRQDYLQAENSFKEALGYAPEDYFALSNLGVVQFQLGKLKDAEDALLKASRGKTDSSFALTTLGIVYYRQQRSEDAEKALRKAIAVNAQDFTAHNYLGIVLAAAGKGSAGESEIMKAIEINPNYADAHFNLAVIYATGKPPSKMMARKHYAKALELGAPPDPSLEHLVQQQ